MRIQSFISDSAASAIQSIREQLGPDAVVLNVRRIPGPGLTRLWGGARIEVLACAPEPAVNPEAVGELRQEVERLKQQVAVRPEPLPAPPEPSEIQRPAHSSRTAWKSASVLERQGVLPMYVEQILDRVHSARGMVAPAEFSQEWSWVSAILHQAWRTPPPPPASNPDRPAVHVFIGPPGSGKTTSLCKWLTRSVLVDGENAHLWRLDSERANSAGLIDLYSEILGVPLDRSWRAGTAETSFGIGLVDLPGADWRDADSLKALEAALQGLPNPHVHLTLNLAYDSAVLLQQARAFANLPVTDLILTHLDEEPRWGKAWNLVLGTNYTLGFLSTGQNIPGDLLPASPEMILTRQFSAKTGL